MVGLHKFWLIICQTYKSSSQDEGVFQLSCLWVKVIQRPDEHSAENFKWMSWAGMDYIQGRLSKTFCDCTHILKKCFFNVFFFLFSSNSSAFKSPESVDETCRYLCSCVPADWPPDYCLSRLTAEKRTKFEFQQHFPLESEQQCRQSQPTLGFSLECTRSNKKNDLLMPKDLMYFQSLLLPIPCMLSRHIQKMYGKYIYCCILAI